MAGRVVFVATFMACVAFIIGAGFYCLTTRSAPRPDAGVAAPALDRASVENRPQPARSAADQPRSISAGGLAPFPAQQQSPPQAEPAQRQPAPGIAERGPDPAARAAEEGVNARTGSIPAAGQLAAAKPPPAEPASRQSPAPEAERDSPPPANDRGGQQRCRTWTSANGAGSVEAEFICTTRDGCRLRKPDGTVVDVPRRMLTESDWNWAVEEQNRLVHFKMISLPSGALFQESQLDPPSQLKALFPATAKCYVDSYVKPGNPKRHEPDQTILRGGYTLKTGHLESLNGPSATLFEDGSLSGLAYYKSSLRHGKLLVWDKENRPLYYGEYVRGKKMGLVCLFVDGHPALIQECNSGEVTAQYLVAFNKSAPVAVPEDRLTPRQTAEFKTAADKLALFESDIDEGEKKVKACVAAWVKQNTVAMAHERYDASARRSAARHAADDAAMGEMWQGAMRRSGM